MAIRLFGIKPLFWPTLMTLPAVLGALALGTWQVQRLQWKNELIAERQARREAPPLAALPENFDPARHAFRKVRVSGRFLHAKEIHLAALTPRGNHAFHIVTPMRLEGGGILLVNRGWVPRDRKEPQSRGAGQVEGTVSLEGYLRVPPALTWAQRISGIKNDPAKNVWLYADLAEMARFAGLGEIKPYILEAEPGEAPGGFPVGGITRFELPNDHLQYALTWYSMALIGIAIYLLYHRRRARDLAGTTSA
jgi:surfeit locus 1 family protein